MFCHPESRRTTAGMLPWPSAGDQGGADPGPICPPPSVVGDSSSDGGKPRRKKGRASAASSAGGSVVGRGLGSVAGSVRGGGDRLRYTWGTFRIVERWKAGAYAGLGCECLYHTEVGLGFKTSCQRSHFTGAGGLSDDVLELRLKRWAVWGLQFEAGFGGIDDHGKKQPRGFTSPLKADLKQAIAPKLAEVGLCEADLEGL